MLRDTRAYEVRIKFCHLKGALVAAVHRQIDAGLGREDEPQAEVDRM